MLQEHSEQGIASPLEAQVEWPAVAVVLPADEEAAGRQRVVLPDVQVLPAGVRQEVLVDVLPAVPVRAAEVQGALPERAARVPAWARPSTFLLHLATRSARAERATSVHERLSLRTDQQRELW